MDLERREYAKRQRKLSSPSTEQQPPVRGDKRLLIEFSFWEEKQQAELTQLRTTVTKLSRENGDLRKKHGAADVELRHAHRLIAALDQNNEALHKKYNSDDRRADSWEQAYDDLKTELSNVEAQNEKLVKEKHRAIAEALQEKARNGEKLKEVGNLTRELKGLAKTYQNLHKRHEQVIGRKKAEKETSDYNLRSKEEQAKQPRVVQCSQCYTKKWPCDAGHPCQACIARGIPGGCKRVKCQFWTKGTCPKSHCGLAHEDDGFPVVIEHRKLKQKLTVMPEEVKRSLTAPSRARPLVAGDTHQDHTTPYNSMDQTPDGPSSVNNRVNMRFETFTARAEFSHRSLEEFRHRDYTKAGRRYTQYADSHTQNPFFKWDLEFPGGPLQSSSTAAPLLDPVTASSGKRGRGHEDAAESGESTKRVKLNATAPAPDNGSSSIDTSKKRGRGHEDAAEGDESNKRVKLNITALKPDHGNASNAAFMPHGMTTQQAHIVQEAQHLDPMDEDSDPEDSTNLAFETFTIAPNYRHQSLEEYRARDYEGGCRILYYPGGMCNVHCRGENCAVHDGPSQAAVPTGSTSFPGGPLGTAQRRDETSRDGTT